MSGNAISRRRMLKTTAASLAAGTASVKPLFAAQKAPGETRVLFLVGDYYHNANTQEYHWREVLGPTGWRLMFAQSPDFITPGVLDDTDLFVLCRYATATQTINLSLGWSPDKIIEKRPAPPAFMTPEFENAIVGRVNRGMGLLSIHCSIWNPESKKYLDLLGVEKPVMHGPVVPATVYDLNQSHPVTKGIEPFDTGEDEVFDAVMKPGQFTPLFRSKQENPARDAIGGWCREAGSGRVVALMPGHTPGPYQKKPFKEIMWRSAHWALKRDIPPSGIREGY
ncbi:ThuA domain-containing protein [bacterium]|nr:ThuA domain-containing protein [bacterium]